MPQFLGKYVNQLYSFFLFLGNSLESEFYMPTFLSTLHEDGTEYFEMSAHKIQKPGNHPKARIQHSELGESLKRKICSSVRTVSIPDKI